MNELTVSSGGGVNAPTGRRKKMFSLCGLFVDFSII